MLFLNPDFNIIRLAGEKLSAPTAGTTQFIRDRVIHPGAEPGQCSEPRSTYYFFVLTFWLSFGG